MVYLSLIKVQYVLVLLEIFIPLYLCELNLDGYRYNFDDLYRDPCVSECLCKTIADLEEPGYKIWSAKRYAVYSVWQEERFLVNCTSDPHSSIPKSLPFNTTDLIVENYNLGLLSMESFPNTHFPSNPMLLSIALRNCSIDYLFPGTFQGDSFVSIRSIVLSSNLLEFVAGGIFHGLNRVHNILIDSNALQVIHESAFRNLPEVYAINLSHNAIAEIESGAFDNLPLLRVLDLSYNNLTMIPGKDIAELPSLQILDLSGNRWNCSCEMSWVLNSSSVLANLHAICDYPTVLNGTPLQQLRWWNFYHCPTVNLPISLKITLFIFLAFAVILCVVLLYYESRQYHKPLEKNDINKTTMSTQTQHNKPLENYNVIKFGRIEYNLNDVLGEKGNVFEGTFEERPECKRSAAIKVHHKNLKPKEVDILLSIQRAPPNSNVIRYLGIEENFEAKVTYIALELCGGNLKNAIECCKERFLPFLTAC